MSSLAPFAHGEDIVVVRPAGFDNHGDAEDPSEHEIRGVVIYDATVDEAINGTSLDADFVMLGAYGIDVQAEDTIYRKVDVDRQHPFSVTGQPWQIKHPMTGWEAGSRTLLNQRLGGLR